MAQPIGALRAELSANIARFESDMGKAARIMESFSRRIEKQAQRVSMAGQAMSVGLTAPLLAIGYKAGQAAGNYEAALNRVEAATLATTAQMDALDKKARELGRDKRFVATAQETALAMEALAKNGLTVEQVLGGAAEAALLMASATGGELEPAANLTADIMKQFGIDASEAGAIVDRVSGALVVSKFAFDDYRLAIGQAGGFAAGAGVSFEDLNVALAATAAYFGSGSDAGTSYKAFLARLIPQSREAERVMNDLGISFYDADGNMKDLATVAEILREKVGGLSEEAQNKVLYTLFGADAMRTGIALMKQGAEGINDVRKQVEGISAASQAEARLKGLNGAILQIRKSVENLMLRFGEAGLTEFLTKLALGVSSFVDKMAELPDPVLRAIMVFGGLAAAVGPLLVALGAVMGAIANLAPLIPVVMKFGAAIARVMLGLSGPVGWAIAAVILFKDQVIAVLGFLASEMARLLGPKIQSIIAKLQKLLGPEGFGPVIDIIGAVVTAVGNLAAMLLAAVGHKVIKAIETFLTVIDSALGVIVGFVDMVSALFAGDWAGAWEGAMSMAESALAGLSAVLDNFLPGFGEWVSAVAHELWGNFAKNWEGALNYVKDRFPEFVMAFELACSAAIDWARNLYNGVKTWIMDNLGPLIQWAIDRINDLQGAFSAISGQAPKKASAPTPVPKAASPPKPKVITSRTKPLGGDYTPSAKGGGADSIEKEMKKVEKATRKFADHIRDLQRDVGKGLNELTQPKSMIAAEDLRQKLKDYEEAAKEAGVDTAAFAGQVVSLRKRIDELEIAGLAKEAEDFRREVEKNGRAVDEFSRGGMTDLESKLEAVNNKYESLKEKILEDIEAHRVLADVNAEAAESMRKLEGQLGALETAHVAATEAAKAQYEAEEKIRNIEAQIDNESTRQAIEDAKAARGDGAPNTTRQDEMQALERDLMAQRLESARRIAELEFAIQEARRTGDEDELARLEAQKTLEEELYAIVSETTAMQIQAAEKFKTAINQATDALSEEVSTMIMNWEGDLDSVMGIMKELARQLFIKPGTDAAADVLQGVLGSFGGMFANGGTLQAGQWGFAGEKGVEPIFAGSKPLHVMSNRDMMAGAGGSKTLIQNITTPNADSFHKNRRQIARGAKEVMG